MCGIIGYKGKLNACEIVIEGLKKLEYRGYDSWGIAAVGKSGLELTKKLGKIGQVGLADLKLEAANTAIGHTRWATHGRVTLENCHPHVSMHGGVAVVHNGIIENYAALKDFLISAGFRFSSETDTEVIPHLIEHFMKQGLSFEESVRESCKKLEGNYAIICLNKDSSMLIGARRFSPLLLGISDDGLYLASDITAFLEHTNKVVYLEDDEMVVLDGTPKILNILTGEHIERAPKEILWSAEDARKGSYTHYMLKEVYEQSATIKRAVLQDEALVQRAAGMIRDAFGVFFVGCGTSYHACVSAGYEFSRIAKKHVNVVLASEFRAYDHFLTDKTLMVAVSQSGETADLIDAIHVAKAKGVRVLAVTNVMGSTITSLADMAIMMHAGPEICVLSTKSYTSQLAILLLLAYALVGKAQEGKKLIEDVGAMVKDVIEDNLDEVQALAQRFKNTRGIFIIGRGLAFQSALECALKIKEVSYIHAEGFAGGELKHGTIALIDEGTPVFALVTEETKKLTLSNAMEIKSRGGYIIGVNEEGNELYDSMLKVPSVGNADPLLMIIPLQLFAYYLAVYRGLDPDKPRNLAKSVTVR